MRKLHHSVLSPRPSLLPLACAKSSCAELRSHLYLALDIGYLDQETFSRLHAMTEEPSRILGGLGASVEKQKG
ncbi:four helix bundle protein [Desulfobacca acetoxidans]|uniref:four helix bundle protein n=1 Tax=Desulfobacca acetoxidans TaxID=60893 RepID=UPI001F413528|nr:four helix bundle protein [Desulfobacca acetoxidans]